MEYRTVGRSGLRVSTIGFGSWLTIGQTLSLDLSRRCARTAFDLGINFFDTADEYGQGLAELVLGEVLSDFPRDELVIATKVFFPVGPGPNDRGLSRKHIVRQCEKSLRRLQTDYLDLLQCHRFDPEVRLEETLGALDDLIRAGKVLYAGVSEWTADQIEGAVTLAGAHGWDPIVSNQPEYSILNRSIEDAVIPASQRAGVGQLIFSPLAQGVLTGKYAAATSFPPGSRAAQQFGTPEFDLPWNRLPGLLAPERLAIVEGLRAVAGAEGISLAELALAWALRDPAIASAIVGASRPEQLIANAAAAGRRLSADALDAIDALTLAAIA